MDSGASGFGWDSPFLLRHPVNGRVAGAGRSCGDDRIRGGRCRIVRGFAACSGAGSGTAVRQGPPLQAGTAPARFAHLCPAHIEDLPGRPGAATVANDQASRMHGGTVLDFRPTSRSSSRTPTCGSPVTGADYADAGDFHQALVALGFCETLAQRL
ncbi:hypothetical protein [Streptomyces bicolor]|uniref:hypothetical protein n=1 Tax=Streptomyces bicolor TaxID=66874 RepID=UPI00131E23F3|nr:hypothetical protein [Streptomyces bicolor]